MATFENTVMIRKPIEEVFGFLADFDAGLHLTPDHRVGTRTWREWLEAGC